MNIAKEWRIQSYIDINGDLGVYADRNVTVVEILATMDILVDFLVVKGMDKVDVLKYLGKE